MRLAGVAGSFFVFFSFRLCSAVALASMMPISQSVLTDLIPVNRRGRAFGRLGFWSGMGGMVGGSLSTAVASKWITMPLAGVVRGWRGVFWLVGGVSMALAALVKSVMVEPKRAALPRGDQT